MFEEVNKKLGKWIQVLDKNNTNVTIENFDYFHGVHGPITEKHCDKCVSINKCWFKNEQGKKPEPYSITNIKWLDAIANEASNGLYHYNCHCYENPIITPKIEDIQLVIPEGKEGWLFKDKDGWVKAMGYKDNYKILNVLCEQIKQAYSNGNYKIIKHNHQGVKINLFLSINGDGEKSGHIYPVKSSFMIFPNGKLKCNTFIGGWWK